MATTTIKSGAQNKPKSTILNAGPTANTTDVFNVAILDTVTQSGEDKLYRGKLPDGSVASSGNLGSVVLKGGAQFARLDDTNFIIRTWNNMKLNGTASNLLRHGSETKARRSRHAFRGYQRHGYSSWDYATGTPTYNSGRGDTIVTSGIDNTTGINADHEILYGKIGGIPGEFTINDAGNPTPQNKDYEVKYST